MKNVFKPGTGLYKLKERHGRVTCVVEPEACGRLVRTHAGRLQRISSLVTETTKRSDGVLLDSLQTFEKIFDVEWRENAMSGMRERHFKVGLSRRRSSR